VETHVLNCLREFKLRGHEPYLAYKKNSPKELITRVNHLEIPHFPLPLRGVNDLGSLLALYRFCRDRDIDIIHAHHANEAFRSSIISRFHTCRFFFTRHGCYGLSKLTVMFLARATRIIAISDAVRSFLINNGLPERNIVRMYHGVSSDFVPSEMEIERKQHFNSHPTNLIYVGRLCDEKDTILAIKVLDWLVNNSPDKDWQLTILGKDYSNDQHYVNELHRTIRARRLQKRVTFEGYVADPAPHLKQAHIGIVTSRIEGFGLAMLEMMASGLPIISTDCEGPREIVQEGINGFICRRNPDDFGKQITTIMHDEDFYCRLSNNNMNLYQSKFTLARMADELEDLYRGD